MRRGAHVGTIELCGPPGAGKSRLAGALAERLAAEGVDVTQPLAAVAPTRPLAGRFCVKVFVAAGELGRAPVEAGRALVAIGRSGQSPRDALHRSLNWLVVRGLYRRARGRAGVHLFDQGIVQELCSIGYAGGDWRACLAAAGPGAARLGPDVLIEVAASVDTGAARLEARPGRQSRVERLEHGALRRELQRQASAVAEVAQVWFDRHGTTLGARRVAVRNDEAPLAETAAALTALVGPAGRGARPAAPPDGVSNRA